MSISEFDLIDRYVAGATAGRDDVALGIGDDCALLRPPPGQILAVSVDTLVAGRHFFPNVDPESLGHKSLAVNLSDLAAMGATPAWATLALTMPTADEHWLEAFMAGFSALAAEHRVQLVGGDTTRGPLSVSVQVHGFVAAEAALRRSGGQIGDWLFVSGTLGDAALALRQVHDGEVGRVQKQRLERPIPRVALGILLRRFASAAIDVSDGLVSDLGHLCHASGVGACLALSNLPLSNAVATACANGDWELPLAGGDDYELLFSVPPDRVGAMRAACAEAGHRVSAVGRFIDDSGIRLIYPDGNESKEVPGGFDHFRD